MNKFIFHFLMYVCVVALACAIGCMFGYLPGGIAAGGVIIFVTLVAVLVIDHFAFGDDYIVQGTPGTGRYYSAEEYRKSMPIKGKEFKIGPF